jgi:DNA-binding NtrC family response regulator
MSDTVAGVLIMDANPEERSMISLLLEQNGYITVSCADFDEAWHGMLRNHCRLFIVRVTSESLKEVEIKLGRLRAAFADMVVFIALEEMTGAAVQLLSRFRIDGFFQIPLNATELVDRVRKALIRDETGPQSPKTAGKRQPGGELAEAKKAGETKGETPALDAATARRFSKQLLRLRDRTAPVLLTGEAGSEFARVARYLSKPQALLRCNAADLSATEVLEGVEDFSNAWLIGDCENLSPAAQEALCGFFLNRISPAQPRRWYFTTSVELSSLEENQRFSPQLYLRLCTGQFHIPPLRTRLEDVPAIAASIYRELLALPDGPDEAVIDSPVKLRLMDHDWSGNFDELFSVLQRAALLGEGNRLRAETLMAVMRGGGGQPSFIPPFARAALPAESHQSESRQTETPPSQQVPGFGFEKYLKFQ